MLPVKLVTVPKPQMPEEKLRKLTPVDKPEEDLGKKKAEPVLVNPQATLTEISIKAEQGEPEVNLVPPTHEINC